MAASDTELKPRNEKNKDKKLAKTNAEMSLSGHLGELRTRILWSVIAIAACTVLTWFFHKELVTAFLDLAKAANPNIKAEFIFLDIASGFTIYFEVAFVAGIMLASPILIYHILAFVAPALEPERQPGEPGYEQEVKTLNSIRKSLKLFIPVVAIFFLAGVLFAYYLVLPAAVKFLLNFGGEQIKPSIDTKKYIGQMTRIMFWMGLVFELPIFLYLLARLRVVTWKRLAGFWKIALVLALVAAAFISPSPDIAINVAIALPIFGLFWLGVLFARFA